ncbi:MAG: hypothetical protein ABIK44_01205 [candidate division WOR-3 bacterium]
MANYRDGKFLYQPGLERILPHCRRGFAILSSNQNRDEESERSALATLQGQLRRLGAPFIELDGVWVDAAGKTFREKALFVPYPGEGWQSLDAFLNKLAEIAREHHQDGIVASNGQEVTLVWADGRTSDFGGFHPDRLAKAYSMISRSRHKGQSFAFEGVRVPGGPFEALVMKKSGHLVEGEVRFEVKGRSFRFGE